MNNKKYWLRGAILGFLISFGGLYVIGLFSEPVAMRNLNYNPFAFAQRFIFNPENMLAILFVIIIIVCVLVGTMIGVIYQKKQRGMIVE